jgi:hypothetical protein
LDRLFRRHPRIFGALLGNKLHHFVGQFVSPTGAAFAGKEAEDSLLLKCPSGLVERRAGKPKARAGWLMAFLSTWT